MKFQIRRENIAPVLLLIACFTTRTTVTSAPAKENAPQPAIPPENALSGTQTNKNLLSNSPNAGAQYPQYPQNPPLPPLYPQSPYYQYPVPPNPFYEYPDGGFYYTQPSYQNGVNGYNPYLTQYQYPYYRASYQQPYGSGYQNTYGSGYQYPFGTGYQSAYGFS